MSVKRSAREIKEMEFAQKNADEAIKRHMDENLELLKLMRGTIEKLGEVQAENASLITTIESQQAELDDYFADSNEQLFTIKALTDVEAVHLQQIESLKAITELAVKGLKMISRYPHYPDDSHNHSFQTVQREAVITLSEIERLQNASPS